MSRLTLQTFCGRTAQICFSLILELWLRSLQTCCSDTNPSHLMETPQKLLEFINMYISSATLRNSLILVQIRHCLDMSVQISTIKQAYTTVYQHANREDFTRLWLTTLIWTQRILTSLSVPQSLSSVIMASTKKQRIITLACLLIHNTSKWEAVCHSWS